MRKSKRILAIALLVTVLLSVLPFSGASAAALQIEYSASSSYRSSRFYSALSEVTLTGDQVTDIVNIAKSQIGYHESSSAGDLSGYGTGSGNCTEYGAWYGMQSDWCNMFVSWCASVAGVSASVFPRLPSCTASYQSVLPAAGALCFPFSGGYDLEPGDLIFCCTCSGSYGCIDHVGLVVNVTDDAIETVEGNLSEQVKTVRYPIASGYSSGMNAQINYVARPAYEDNSASIQDVNNATALRLENGSLYALYDLSLSAADAKKIAADMGGHLADLTSSAELKTASSLIGEGALTRYYVGLNDSKENGTYFWSDGTKETAAQLSGYSAFPQVTMNAAGTLREAPSKKRQTGFLCEIDCGALSPVNTAVLSLHRYEVYDAPLTAEQAALFAKSLGGTLATLDTDAERALLPLLLKDSDGYYIASSDKAPRLLLADGTVEKAKNYEFGRATGFLVEYNDAATRTVVYDANGGSGTPIEQLASAGRPVTLSAVQPEREGYRFSGWSVRENARVAQYAAGESFLPAGDTVLYAVWKRA